MGRTTRCLVALLLGLSLGKIASVNANDSAIDNITSNTINLPASECVFYGTFEQKQELASLDKPLHSNGVFFYHCDYGVIWSTKTPIYETLVLKADGTGAVIKESQTHKLKSQHSRFLGTLLNGLMGSDVDSVKAQFDIEQLEAGTPKYLLKPKKRRIRRAIKKVVISMPKDQDPSVEAVTISITDRNSQLTEIRSYRNTVFSRTDEPLSQCHQGSSLSKESCQQLLDLQ